MITQLTWNAIVGIYHLNCVSNHLFHIDFFSQKKKKLKKIGGEGRAPLVIDRYADPELILVRFYS